MSKPKDDMFSTNIRMPKHLAHKLGILAESDDRSLNSFMVKALQEHVTEFEESIVSTYGIEDFPETYASIFGEEHSPYIMFEQVSFDMEQVKHAVKNIMRGNVTTLKTVRQSSALKEVKEFNRDNTPTE